MWRGWFSGLAVVAVLLTGSSVATSAAPISPPPPPLPRDLPVLRAPVVARPMQPAALTRSVPRGVADLLAIQTRVGELVEDLSKATVGLRIGNGAGSGVIVSADGYVLSAAHVTGTPNRRVSVMLSDGRILPGHTLGLNRELDASVLKIDVKGPFPFRRLARPKDVRTGDWCLALGHPGGYQSKRAPVVRLGRVIRTESGFLQTDCTLVGGDSGGPLFDLSGNVIGIHSRIGPPTSWNFHVPIRAYTESWVKFVDGVAFGRRNRVRQPVLGINGVDHDLGCTVTAVSPNLPAARAGVRSGDVIVKVDGRGFEGFDSLFNHVQNKKPGDKLRLSIQRNGKAVEITVTLAGGRGP
jgi:serine protease Do